MALGNSRPRNGGVEWQNCYLALELHRHQLAYRVTRVPGPTRISAPNRPERKLLWLTGSNAQLTLPFVESYCYLEHVRSGRWIAVSEWDGKFMAAGCSLTDVIGKTIRATYNKPRSEWPSDPEQKEA